MIGENDMKHEIMFLRKQVKETGASSVPGDRGEIVKVS